MNRTKYSHVWQRMNMRPASCGETLSNYSRVINFSSHATSNPIQELIFNTDSDPSIFLKMDKIATNNLVVDLRTDVKAAKSMVAGNLVRKINELKKAIEKDNDPAKKEKAEKKIEALHADIKLLKTIDPYIICKNAILKPDPKHWSDLVGDSKAPEETKLMARVIAKGRIQKQVAKFRSDHKDCGEWLEEYFEFREKKRELTEVKVAKRKTKQTGNKNRSFKKASDVDNDGESTNENPRKAKRFNQKGRKSPGKDQTSDGTGDHSRNENRNHARGNNRNHPRDDRKNHPRNDNRSQARHQNRDHHARSHPRGANSDQAGNNFKPKQESLHPSWASKRKEKEILKAALSGKAPEQPKRIVLNSA